MTTTDPWPAPGYLGADDLADAVAEIRRSAVGMERVRRAWVAIDPDGYEAIAATHALKGLCMALSAVTGADYTDEHRAVCAVADGEGT